MSGANCPCGSNKRCWWARDTEGRRLYRVCASCSKRKQREYFEALARGNHASYFNVAQDLIINDVLHDHKIKVEARVNKKRSA